MSTEVTIDTEFDSTRAVGEAAGIRVATQLYEQIPTNDAGGQAFKNSFIKEFLKHSPRAQLAAKAFFDPTVNVKPVQADYSDDTEVDDDAGWDDDDDTADDEGCCKCCR